MEWFEFRRKTKLHNANTRRCLPIHRNISWAWPLKSHNNTENHHYPKRHRYDKHLYAVASACLSLITCNPTYAEVGGISATANSAFSFSNSFTTGDASNATGTNSTAYTAGAAGTAAPGLITNAHTVTIAGGTAGSGSGSTVTGQFVSEVTIFD